MKGPRDAWAMAGWATLPVLALAWEGVARSGLVRPFLLPPLTAVLERVWTDAAAGDLWRDLASTLYRALVGFALAASIGTVLGILIARDRIARWFFDPLISIGFPMPKIAFMPVIALWLGYFDTSKIVIVAFDAVFPVIVATAAGASNVERELIWSARNLGAGTRRVLWEVVLPAALPQIVTGLQVSLPVALIVAIITEMMMGGTGLGAAMTRASRFADSPGVFAGILEIALVGLILVKGMALVRRRLLLWHPETLAEATVA